MCCDVTCNLAADSDPFDESLWGEYARILVIGTASCTAALWGLRLASEPASLVMVVTNVVIMSFAIGNRFAGLVRMSVVLMLAVGLVATLMVNEGSVDQWWSPLAVFSPAVTVGALVVLGLRDGVIAIRKRAGAVSAGTMVTVAAIIAIGMYMVVLPSVDAFLETFRERPQSFVVEDLSTAEVLRIRSAKLAVFAIFAYAGACVGSFLNVVAASAPRGEPIALRSSACPKCGTPIRRVDNLPIVSYLRLRGRCRDCGVEIPIRYFAVELMGFAIFALLFLGELVTGGANVAGFPPYQHVGILWIILYTKWPVIGVYFLHCLLFSCVLTYALVEQDRLRFPRWMTLAVIAFFAAVVVVFPTMLTVSLGDQTPFQFPAGLPEWLDRAVTSAAGAMVGWGVAHLATPVRLRRGQSSLSLVPAFVLIGVALGWQAVVTIAVVWGIAIKVWGAFPGRMRPLWLTATTLLFAVSLVHHLVWSWLAENLSL